MAWGTIFGFLAGIALFMAAVWLQIQGDGTTTSATTPWDFVSGASAMIVFGGTLASAFVSFRPRYVMLALKSLLAIARKGDADRNYLNRETGQMIAWGYLVKREGLVALETEVRETEDRFVQHATQLLITNYDPASLREMLTSAVESTFVRDMVPVKVLRYMGAAAPAFGMIGTLVGLVDVLMNLGGDGGADKVGSGMAVALLTTLYGVMAARLIFIPAANKMQQNHEIVRFRNWMMLDGFMMLAEEKSPRFIQDRLNSSLDESIHYDIDTQMRRG